MLRRRILSLPQLGAQDVRAEYDFVRELSHTTAESADTVWLVRNRRTEEACACKRISKRQETLNGCSCR